VVVIVGVGKKQGKGGWRGTAKMIGENKGESHTAYYSVKNFARGHSEPLITLREGAIRGDGKTDCERGTRID